MCFVLGWIADVDHPGLIRCMFAVEIWSYHTGVVKNLQMVWDGHTEQLISRLCSWPTAYRCPCGFQCFDTS